MLFLVQVTKMKMISPSNREVDVGKTLSETEYIGMCRREVLDAYLRDRAKSLGATVYNGLFMRMERVRNMRPLSLMIVLGDCCSGYLQRRWRQWQKIFGHGHRSWVCMRRDVFYEV